MRAKKTWLACVASLGLLSCGPRPDSQHASPSDSSAPSASSSNATAVDIAPATNAQLVKGSNALGLALYGRLASGDGNLALSPASISIALSMTYGGAKGETAAQMDKVLGFDAPPTQAMRAMGALQSSLTRAGQPITLRIANQLFAEKTYTFEQSYLDATLASFGAPVERVDFKKDAEGTRRHINTWVERQTEKRIKELLPNGVLKPTTRLVLINAVYFKGRWESPFDASATSDQDFTLAKGKKAKVPTMHQMANFGFAEGAGARVVRLPFTARTSDDDEDQPAAGAPEYGLYIVLPTDVAGLPALERALDATALDKLLAGVTYKFVDLALPKFEVAPEASTSLAENLTSLGMKDAFDMERADFTGIANPPDPAARLFIQEVLHKALVRVDEEGTEAAAATAVMMGEGTGMPPRPEVVFNADHPFLFVLREDTTGMILFLGRVVDPRAN
ncbi:MAG: serpin family protein [Polyangiaceae bacterium]